MIKKLLFTILVLSLMMGAAFAVNVDGFEVPSNYHKLSAGSYSDGEGRAIHISEDTPINHEAWFENDTGYVVKPFKENNSFHMFFESAGELGILEIVEKSGENYIVNSWTRNGPDDCYTIIWYIFEFNNLNNLTPVEA